MAGPIALCFMGAAFRLPRAGQGYDPHRTGCRAASADQHRRKPRRAARDPPQRGELIDEGIRQLPDGRWQARPTLGTDPVTGRQVRAVKTFPTKREAKNWVKDQHNQWDWAAWAPRTHLTLDEVADHWLRLREAEVGVNTLRADRDSLAYARRAFGAGAGAEDRHQSRARRPARFATDRQPGQLS